MKINDVIHIIESIAHRSYQESYDNAQLIVGDKNATVKGVLLCLDSTEAILDEAIAKGCNLVIAHHPIVFSGLKSLTGKNYIERTIIKAIKHDIAIYACHTNLDNVHLGVNAKIAEKLNLQHPQILAPKKGKLKKLYTYVPETHIEVLKNALFETGAGQIGNYSECSFTTSGKGTFRGNNDSNPVLGNKNERANEAELKLEILFESHLEGKILSTLKKNHPYEEVAYEIISLENNHQNIGSGMIGNLLKPMKAMDFLHLLKSTMKTNCIRYTKLLNKPIEKVAVCGGSGSFLLNAAIVKEADIFITGDYKYHQFFDADGQIIIADIGHYESEQYTIDLFHDLLKEKMVNFALHKTEINTNPINYL